MKTLHLPPFFALLFAIVAEPVSADPVSSCVSCHEKEATVEQHSIHKTAAVSCVDCHGGDATKTDKEASKAPEAGYKGKLTKAQVAETCGGCHSDVRKMNTFGLPTDQLAQYKASHHGEALFGEGNQDVASCADCHDAHGTLSRKDPRSTVYAKNVPKTCGRCHSDSDLMSSHDLKTNQESLYRQSVHAELLFDKGDVSAPTCVTCHGNHGAVPPGFAKVGLVCGKCHIKQKEFFDQSPHASPAKDGEFETCVTCHSNHKVTHPSEAIFGKCKTCHEEGDKAFTAISDIRRSLMTARQRYEDVRLGVQQASRAGFDTDDEQMLLEEAKTYVLQLAPVQHTLNSEEVTKVATQVAEVSGKVEELLKGKQQAVHMRKMSLIPIGFFLVMMSLVFRAKLKQIQNG